LSKKNLILGFGQTGVSIAKYLHKSGIPFEVMESRKDLIEFQWLLDHGYKFSNVFDVSVLERISKVYVSPGISNNNPVLMEANFLNIEVETDIDIFLRLHSCIKILISGTNGKTTVTSMSHKLFSDYLDGKRVEALGNIGKAVLDNIDEDIDIALIEVSSYQLELSSSISSDIAVLLNVTQDHLDRHSSFEDYKSIKNKVFNESKLVIKDGRTDLSTKKCFYFKEIFYEYDYCFDDLKGVWPLHDIENIKAAISILLAYLVLKKEISFNDKSKWKSFIVDCLDILDSFQRLAHRYEILDLKEGVTYINDSKATNVASTVSALESVQDAYGNGKAILICGGDSKGQDFEELKTIPKGLLKKVYIFGKHKDLIAPYFKNHAKIKLVKDLKDAMKQIITDTVEGDVVILSPACSSIDMYKNYKERGDEFRRLVSSV
jgi:UDP-N-acetylmuramoylalanine--D-glutamate ligase